LLGAEPAAETVVSSYGVRVGLQASDDGALARLVAALPGRWNHDGGARAPRVYGLTVRRRGRPRYVLRSDGEELARADHFEPILEALTGSVGFYVAESTSTRTFVHAGVVGWGGRAIVVPGKQNSGKTTLTAALVRAGATYLSDEYAPFDDRARVDPFPRPLSVRQPDGVSVRLHEVEALGGVRETRRLPVGLVVLAPYTGVRRWRPRSLTGGEAVLAMLAHTVTAQTKPRQALERLATVAVSARVLQGNRGDAEETAQAVIRRLEAAVEESSTREWPPTHPISRGS
jgi:hypothetical protein